MCGIAGFWSQKKIDSETVLKKMTFSLSHRGPDADGFYIDSNSGVAMGHRRLSILDLSDAANQPFYSENNRYIIVYNGEVYNFRELQKNYLLKESFKTTSDTEVILKLFIQKGPEFVRLLNGMFAISIYDKEESKLYLFRDHIGIKPIYYYYSNELFVFGSELKSVKLFFNDENLTLSHEAIFHYFNLGYIPEPFSIYKEIKKFPSGHYAIINKKSFNLYNYWKPNDYLSNHTLNDEFVALSELKELIQNAVTSQMISDVPFGTFLSGGIDSSLVTAIASQKADKLNTFSIGFDDSKHNEAVYAKNISEYLCTHHTEFKVTEKEAIDLIPELISIYDEPFADSSSIPTLMVSKLAKNYVKMALTGDGGDEQFMGYGAYKWANRMSNPFIYYNRHLIASILNTGNIRHQRAAKVFQIPNQSFFHTHIFSQEQYLFSMSEIKKILNPQWLMINPLKIDFPDNRNLSAAEKQAWFDLNYYLKDDLLVKVDRATMKYGLEARVPLLDHRIIEWSINLNENLKTKNQSSKYLLKKLLFQFIPESYFDRPKWGFSIPLDKWLKNELKYLIDHYLSNEKLSDSEILNKTEVNKITQAYLNGKTYLYNRVWAMIMFQMFIEKKNY